MNLPWHGSKTGMCGPIEDIDQLAWLLEQCRWPNRSESAPNEFSVRWTGTIEAPADGQYTFSTTPFDLNFDHGKWFRKQTFSVSIGGQKVLDSGNERLDLRRDSR